jgi:hypothetical protein
MSMEKSAAAVRAAMGDSVAHPRQHTGVEIVLKSSGRAHSDITAFWCSVATHLPGFKL